MNTKMIKNLHQDSSSNSQTIVHLVAAGIIGATAALLLAPKAGSKLRQDIRDVCSMGSDTCSESHSKTPLVIGAVAGGLLGAALIYYLAKRDEEVVSEGIGHKIKEAGKTVVNNATDWIETAKDVVDTIHDSVHQFDEKVETKTEKASANLDEIIEWAQLGLRVWNNIQKRK